MSNPLFDPELQRFLGQVEELRWTLRFLHEAVEADDTKNRVARFENAWDHAGTVLRDTVVVPLAPTDEGPTDAVDVEVLAVDATMLAIADTPGHPLADTFPEPMPLLLADAKERHDLLRSVQFREHEPNLRLTIRPGRHRRICAAWDTALVLSLVAGIPPDQPLGAEDNRLVGAHLTQLDQHLGRVIRETKWSGAAATLEGCRAIKETWHSRNTKAVELAELVSATTGPLQQLVTAELTSWHRGLPREARTRARSYVPVLGAPGAPTTPGAGWSPPSPRRGSGSLGRAGG